MVHLLTYKITDSGGKSKSAVFPIPEVATYTEICAMVLEQDSLLDAVISGVITSASVQMACPIDGGLNDTPAANMSVQDGGLLGFSVADSEYRTSIYIPTYSETLIDNYRVIADAGATAALLTAMLAGANADVSDKDGNIISAFLGGTRRHRK